MKSLRVFALGLGLAGLIACGAENDSAPIVAESAGDAASKSADKVKAEPRTPRKPMDFHGGLTPEERDAHERAKASVQSQSDADLAVVREINQWQPGSPLPSEETIARAIELSAAGDFFPDAVTARTLAIRLADIEQTKANEIVDRYNKVIRAYKDKAQEAILETANAFTLALKSRDREAIKNLIDWDQYHNYLTFKGQDQMIQASFPKPSGDADGYYAPFSHKLEAGLVPKTDDKGQPILDTDGKPLNMYVIKSHTLRDIANMQDEGIDYLLAMYGTETINAMIDSDANTGLLKVKGTPDIEGAPSGSSMTHYFYGDVNYDNGKGAHYEIANKPIRVFIGGEWGSHSAKIVALFDRTTKQWLTRIRDEAFHRELQEESGDKFR